MSKNAKIVIVDYGVGNLRSLIRAFEYNGCDIAITEEAQKIRESDAIVLPGDGASSCSVTHAPAAVTEGRLRNSEGKWGDASASLQVDVALAAGESKTVVFLLGSTLTKEDAEKIIKKYSNFKTPDQELSKVKAVWDAFVDATYVETPDESLNFMTNIWLKYQAISARLWARCAYYQSSGGFGYRDQLQDCQIFFSTKPELARKQILLHAEQQFPDGTVYHWWHHGTGMGAITHCSDDLLWLDFITLNYLDETQDYALLDAKAKFLPDPKRRGFGRAGVQERRASRGPGWSPPSSPGSRGRPASSRRAW